MSLADDEIREFVDELIEQLPLKDLVSFANMDESGMEVTQQVLDLYIQHQLGDQAEFPNIMKALWKRVRETHRLRMV